MEEERRYTGVLKIGMRAVAGISGGRTSARMAYLLPKRTVLTFENTGKEASKTYEFIDRVEQDLGRPIVRLEWHAPPRGEPPINATVHRVTSQTMARKGEPFRDLLECLAAFRAKVKGKGPIAPWAKMRLCTAYLKVKTQVMYCERTLKWGYREGRHFHQDWTSFVGLRADEPERVALMRGRNDKLDTDERAPLFTLGITKPDVMAFWRSKPFDLELPEHMGNCTGCFLKDERDLADALIMRETDAEWWIGIERDFAPMRRGGRPSYQQVLAEAFERRKIRAALDHGEEPVSSLAPRRHLLIVRQEKAPREPFSCMCEGAERLSEDELLAAE